MPPALREEISINIDNKNIDVTIFTNIPFPSKAGEISPGPMKLDTPRWLALAKEIELEVSHVASRQKHLRAGTCISFLWSL